MSNLGESYNYTEVKLITKIIVNPWIFFYNIPWYLGFGYIYKSYL